MNHSIHIALGGRKLVDIDDFRVEENHVTLLLGESGIGKTLITKALYGLLDPEEFDIRVDDEPYGRYLHRERTKEIQRTSFFVFQEPSSHLNPLLRLQTQLQEGSLSSAADEKGILGRLWEKGGDFRDILSVYPKPHRPSGGEKQRLFLAMAFKKIDQFLSGLRMQTATMFVFDEPTGSLDNHYRDLFLSLLFERFQERNFTALLVTHDYSMISEINRHYHHLMNRISFKELAVGERGVVLKDFVPQTYLGWLQEQKPVSRRENSTRMQRTLLKVESGIEVFGRTLSVSKDSAGTEVCPLEVFPGSLVYLKAPSGTGKTTLVKIIMGLIRGNRFNMSLDGMRMTERTARQFWQKRVWGRKLTMVFQHADEALNPHSTVRETFFGLPLQRQITPTAIIKTLEELFDTEIDSSFPEKEVRTLSGGQKQRLNLLRGLFLDTDILIVDEPLNGLDFASTTKVISMLRRKLEAGKGVLVISHNEEIFDTQVSPGNVYYLHAIRTGSEAESDHSGEE